MNRLLLFFTLAAMFSCSKAESAADPVISEAEQTYRLTNQNATAETKRLFALLSDLYGKRILSGTVAIVEQGKYPVLEQFIGHHRVFAAFL